MIAITFFATLITYGLSIKIASYNPYQILTNSLASTIRDPGIAQIANSDLDVICLQEMNDWATMVDYLTKIDGVGYTEQFSLIDIQSQYAPQTLIPPRNQPACDTQQVAALTVNCPSCAPLYGDTAFGACLATACPSEWDKVMYTECIGCLALYPGIQPLLAGVAAGVAAQIAQLTAAGVPASDPTLQALQGLAALLAAYTLDLNGAAAFCLNPPDLSAFPGGVNFQNFNYNITEGTAIVSKPIYPIKNTWSYILEAWIIADRRLNIAEIDICHDTDPNNADCKDSIIVGCVHFGLS